MIGPRALRPPPAGLEPPPLPPGWDARRPARDAAGRPLSGTAPRLEALDGVDPAKLRRDRRTGAHWDGDVWHDGEVRGFVREEGLLRLQRDGSRWWAFAGGRAELRHDGVWWTKENGAWYVVHEGQPWAWRSFQDWDAQGLFQPGSGTEMVYSKDFSRVAVITPGAGAAVFDAATGAELARIPQERMPPRRRPKAPPALEPAAVVFDG
ncbi:MAG TPA: hypothetical protein VH309_08930 [Elusimicrobiota bacterium]|nr:hypothetical protein [Elusimicrobiota bacterium]